MMQRYKYHDDSRPYPPSGDSLFHSRNDQTLNEGKRYVLGDGRKNRVGDYAHRPRYRAK